MRRLVCAFVVRMQQSQGPINNGFVLQFRKLGRKSPATTEEEETIEEVFVQRNRRQSLIGSTVETSDGKNRRMSLIGTTIGADNEENPLKMKNVLEEEQ